MNLTLTCSFIVMWRDYLPLKVAGRIFIESLRVRISGINTDFKTFFKHISLMAEKSESLHQYFLFDLLATSRVYCAWLYFFYL